MAGHPGYWRAADGSAVAAHEAESLWADHALQILRDVGTRFGEQIDYAELSVLVQERSGVLTRVPVMTWIGGVLRQVMQATRAAGEPPLSVLVIAKRGDSSAETSWSTARMQCYRRYCVELPQNMPVLNAPATSRTARGSSRPSPGSVRRVRGTAGGTRSTAPSRPLSRQDAPPALCPSCYLALPATGVCDNCA